MNLIRISKTCIFYKNVFMFPELNLRTTVRCVRNMCIRTERDSNSEKTDPMYLTESDSFGTLRKALESSSKFKYKSTENARQKKRITVKKLKTDESDTFGNLSEKNPMWYPDLNEALKEDNDISDDSVIVKNISKKYRYPNEYLSEMKRLVKAKKIKEALDLFVDMKKNFVTPLHPHFTFMIGVCGRIGYTEMAFKLLRQMTDRSYRPTSATLTGLFNSCAESPFPEYGLKKAHALREKIEMKNWQMTQITYHSMIKAFGKCGDISTAFEIVDEMAKKDIKIDASTYSFLLMSCISNKEAGFTYAVEVWRKMKAKKCPPNTFTCNLLLRTTRDCDIGPDEISCLLLQHWSSYSKRPYGFPTKESISMEPVLKLQGGKEKAESEAVKSTEHCSFGTEESKHDEIPNNGGGYKYELINVVKTNSVIHSPVNSATSLLAMRPINGPEILELVNIKTPNDRLSLIGGMEGFLKFMSDAKVKPNIKTLTLLLECLPPNTEDEERLLSVLEKLEVKPDIDFFNILIKRRNFRKDTVAARDVLSLVNKYELTPDIVTFGVLATGCRTSKQASIFISEMNKFGSTPNIEISGALLKNAIFILDFHYMKYVLSLMEKEEIKPNEKVLTLLEETLKNVRKNIICKEQGKEVHPLYQRQNLAIDYRHFMNFYEEWLKRMSVEIEEHPWLQYKTDIIYRAKQEEIIQ